MSDPERALPVNQLEGGTETYRDVRVVIAPEAPYHYRVEVSGPDGEPAVHAVERVVINTTKVLLDSPICFVGVKLDVGVPLDTHGDTAWVWI